MLNRIRIEQLIRMEQDDRLLDELLANGRNVPLPLRLRLTDPAGRRAAALGLALQRLSELTHGSAKACATVASALIGRQQQDGGFGTLAATVAALAGLTTYLDYAPAEVHPGAIDEAVRRGMASLSAAQDEAGLLAADPILSLFAARMLMLHHDFVASVRFGDLTDALLRSPETSDSFAQLASTAHTLLSAA